MAVGVLMMMPGLKQEQYEQVNEKMFGRSSVDPADAPSGLLVHSAGPTQDGWYVYDIWESKEDFERFGQEKVAPAVQEVMGTDMSSSPPPQFFEIANFVKAG
ncbi:MAG: hypothetical protein ABR569_12225 [Gaiellaceae bacterium]